MIFIIFMITMKFLISILLLIIIINIVFVFLKRNAYLPA